MSDTAQFSIRTETVTALRTARRLFWTGAYITTIVMSNLLLLWLPMVEIFGTMIPPAIITFGFVFVLRDFAQRELGHYVLLAMAVAAALTYLLAGPAIAAASLTAFILGEVVDWGIFSAVKGPFSRRVTFSSIIGVGVDTFVLFTALGILEPKTFVVGSAVKLVGTAAFWGYLAIREHREEVEL